MNGKNEAVECVLRTTFTILYAYDDGERTGIGILNCLPIVVETRGRCFDTHLGEERLVIFVGNDTHKYKSVLRIKFENL